MDYVLLERAIKALEHTLRELEQCPDAGNYGDAIVVLEELKAAR